MSTRLIAAAILAILVVVPVRAAWAFQISTMVHEIDPAESPYSDFYIFNDDQSAALHLVVTIRRWEQGGDGSRILTPTADVAVFPNLLVVEPGERRKVRIGLQRPLAEDVEHAFRLNVRQLAIDGPAPANGQGNAISGALAFTRAFDMPVFVHPKTPRSSVSVRAVRRDGMVAFEVENTGNVNVKLRDLAMYPVSAPETDPVSEPISAVRVLAASRAVVGGIALSAFKGVSAVEPRYTVSLGDVDESRVGEALEISK